VETWQTAKLLHVDRGERSRLPSVFWSENERAQLPAEKRVRAARGLVVGFVVAAGWVSSTTTTARLMIVVQQSASPRPSRRRSLRTKAMSPASQPTSSATSSGVVTRHPATCAWPALRFRP